jgi:hypothetical protein
MVFLDSAKCKLPIYTLNMLNGKVYIITSPNLVSAVNRNSKVLALNPFIAQLGKRITGHDEATSRTVQHNLNGENGSGYVIEVHDGTVAALAPGKNLERMSEAMLREASTYFDKVKDGEVDLFAWTRQMVTMCSTRAIYGPENPFNSNSNLVTAFWFVVTHDSGNLVVLTSSVGILNATSTYFCSTSRQTFLRQKATAVDQKLLRLFNCILKSSFLGKRRALR